MGSHLPNRRQGRVVKLPDLGQAQHRSGVAKAVPVDSLPVHPLGRGSVAPDLQILSKFAIANGSSLRQKLLDLLHGQSIALDCRGMMGLLIPDSAPDPGGLPWTRQAAQALPQLGDIGS